MAGLAGLLSEPTKTDSTPVNEGCEVGSDQVSLPVRLALLVEDTGRVLTEDLEVNIYVCNPILFWLGITAY